MVAVVKGWRNGLVVSAFSFAGLIIGLAAAIKLSAVVAMHLENSFNTSSRWLPLLSFILVLVLVGLLVRWLAKLLEGALKLAMMGWLNRLGGVLLYLILYTTVYSILLFYGAKSHLISAQNVADSKIYPVIASWGPSLIDFIAKFVPFFKNMFTELEDFFQKLSQKIP